MPKGTQESAAEKYRADDYVTQNVPLERVASIPGCAVPPNTLTTLCTFAFPIWLLRYLKGDDSQQRRLELKRLGVFAQSRVSTLKLQCWVHLVAMSSSRGAA